MTDSADLLTTAEAAELAEITPAALRSYSARDQAPRPWLRGYYRRGDIVRWLESRPGRGARTDLHAAPKMPT